VPRDGVCSVKRLIAKHGDVRLTRRGGRGDEWPPSYSHCAVAKSGADNEEGPAREATMVLVPVVLVVGFWARVLAREAQQPLAQMKQPPA
jgi:hypothetical protein